MPGIVSSSLTWEQVRTINGGIDLGFLNNRLTAGFDYYVRYTEGMLTKGKSSQCIRYQRTERKRC